MPRVAKAKPRPDIAVFDPAYEAHKLRVKGTPWREVAAQTGYASVSEANAAVRHYLTQAATQVDAEHKREALQTQLERYEALLLDWWELGTRRHDDKAAGILLKALAQIDRLYNFDAEHNGTRLPEVIVIGGDEQEYTAGLRALVDREANAGGAGGR